MLVTSNCIEFILEQKFIFTLKSLKDCNFLNVIYILVVKRVVNFNNRMKNYIWYIVFKIIYGTIYLFLRFSYNEKFIYFFYRIHRENVVINENRCNYCLI